MAALGCTAALTLAPESTCGQALPPPASKPGAGIEAEAADEWGLWTRDTLTGDWGGLRADLRSAGIELGFTYIGETFANPTGGFDRRWIYEGRFEATLDLDLDRLAGWAGATLHASAYQIHGRGLSGKALGNLLAACNIEARQATRLYTLWLEQALFEEAASIRIGQLAADDEFLISSGASTFINGTFGWPGWAGADLPSGGPAYPLSAPGVRVEAKPADNLVLRAALFGGDPAGRRAQDDPQKDNRYGTTFSFRGGAFLIGEAAYTVGREDDGLPGTYKLGGWYHSGNDFADQRFEASGLSLADPASNGLPRRYSNNWGAYVVADQLLWREPGTEDQGLAAFLRIGGSPSDRNLVDGYFDAGVTYTGLIPGRDADIAGIAIGHASVGDRSRGLDRDVRAFADPLNPVRSHETVIELTYQAQIAPWWIIQPDLQFLFNPGANVAEPNAAGSTDTIGDAIVVGVRSVLKL